MVLCPLTLCAHASDPTHQLRATQPLFSLNVGQAGSQNPSVIRHDIDSTCATPLGDTTVAVLDGLPIVTIIANGAPLTLILDTGSGRTVLSPSAAQRIRAETPRIELARPLSGINGTTATQEIELNSFAVGQMPIPWRRLLVAPIVSPKILGVEADGLLGADVLSQFAVDIDFSHHRVTFYPKRSCAPNWATGHSLMSGGLSRTEHLFFPAELDGHRIISFIDTGSQKTVLSTRVAAALGISDSVLSKDQSVMTRGITQEPLGSHIHTFSKLEFAGNVVPAPKVVITDIKLPDADLVLGMDYLGQSRIWLSYDSAQIAISH